MAKEEAVKTLIDAIQKRDFGAFLNALTFARQEKINVFECSSFLRASEDTEDVRDAMSLFSYLISTGSENRLNDLPRWLNLMLETLDVEWNDTNRYDFSPYYILAFAQRHNPTFFTYEMMYECLESLSRYIDINETDSSGQNVLVYVSDKEIAKLYLTFGADPNRMDREKNLYAQTPLERAVLAYRDIGLAKLLLESGADPNTMAIMSAENASGFIGVHLDNDDCVGVPLLYMLTNVVLEEEKKLYLEDEKTLALTALLLRHKANPNLSVEKSKNTIASWICCREKIPMYPIFTRNTEALMLLSRYGGDTEVKDMDFHTAALRAAIADDNMLLDTLLEAGADIFATSENKYNIFHLPVSENIVNVIKIVMKHAEKRGVVSEAVKTLNARSRWDETPLYYHVRRIIHQKSERFASSDSVDMMKVITAFCDAGADINSRNSNGQTVLHLLSNFLRRENSNLNMTEGDEWIRGVIQLGAEVNAQDNDGKTPLIVMGKRLKDKTITADGFWKIAFPLLEAGADVEIKNNEGNAVFYYLDEEMNRRIRDYQEWEKILAQDLEQDLFERN